MSSTAPIHDVAIAGGGVVGLALALALSRRLDGLDIALVDAAPQRPKGVDRAYAIAPDVRDFLDDLGVWDAVAPLAEPVRDMAITDSRAGDPVRPDLLRLTGGGAPVAHIAPEGALLDALEAALAASRGVVRFNASVASLAAGTAAIEVGLTGGGRLRARLLAAADGTRSACRELAGIRTIGSDYEQSGIVATVSHTRDHAGRAVQHFLPGGPFAMLPLPGRFTSIVWTLPRAEADRLLALPAAEFLAEVEPRFGHGLGEIALAAGPAAFPLRVRMARAFVGDRLALVGDAAHVVHPLAGQGMNLGLRDARALADEIAAAARLGLDIGAPEVTEAYQARRRPAAVAMAATTDGLNRLFSNDVLAVRLLRDFGLGLVERLPAVKRTILAGAAR